MHARSNVKRYFTIIGLILLLLSSCNVPWGLPEPTRKSVYREELVGIWQFENATLELKDDQTFTMTGSRRSDGSGKWSISPSDKMITLVYENRAEAVDIGYVIDSAEDGFGIFGGLCGDPDCWRVMTKEE
jgi:hypothetical protein